MFERSVSLFGLILILSVITIAVLLPESTAARVPDSDSLYLHLYSNRYDINSMGKLPPHPRDWQCIATLSVVPGRPFYFHIPCHYEPEMQVQGVVKRTGTRLSTDFTIDVTDVGIAYRHSQRTPLEINALSVFGDKDFRFAFSDAPENPQLSKAVSESDLPSTEGSR